MDVPEAAMRETGGREGQRNAVFCWNKEVEPIEGRTVASQSRPP